MLLSATKVLRCNEVDEELEQSVAPPTSSHCCCFNALPTLTPGGDKFTPAPRWDPLVLGFNLGSTYTQCEDPIMETNLYLGHGGIPCTRVLCEDPLELGIHF